MSRARRLFSALGGRRVIIAIGLVYVLTAIGRTVSQLSSDKPLLTVLVVASFIGGSGLVLLVGGYRLPKTDVHPAFYPTIAGWCLGGIAVMFAILALYHVQPDTGLTEPNRSVPILTGFGAVAGFGVGTYAGKAKTNARELERRNRKLRHVQRRLEASNERLEQFAYAASHDLQEPLRMVTSYLTLIESRYGDALDEDGEEFLEYAVDGAERMTVMIDDLLAYSRIETQGDPFEPVDLEEVLADVRKDLELRIEETGADVVVAELPRVDGDASQLRQLFQNLVSNAIEYSGDEPPTVRVRAELADDDWLISVSDEGIGIDPDSVDRIFDVFERLHAAEDRAGSGIGLALCKRIVERHGDEIRVDSVPGEGSTFSFRLPPATTGVDPSALEGPTSA
jgi:two-component system, chemotaxis family, sensor kinase Cph1